LADDYLGVAAGDREGQAAELSWLDGRIAQLRGRLATQVASLIRDGLDARLERAAVGQLEDEVALLTRRRDGIARLLAEDEQARSRLSSLERLAKHATGRLELMTLEERGEVLALLDVRVLALADGSLK
jgi:hypothetical protein